MSTPAMDAIAAWRDLRIAGLAAMMIFTAGHMHAQVDRGGTGVPLAPGGTTNYRYAEPGELTIVVSVLGAIRSPGRYEISRKINLMDLIALAGGYQDYADRGDIRLFRLIAGPAGNERKEFIVDLDDLTHVQSRDLQLEEGDIIDVGGSPTNVFDDSLRYLTAGAALLTAGIAIWAVFFGGGE